MIDGKRARSGRAAALESRLVKKFAEVVDMESERR
ncbi:hypothetical protein BKA16_001563 [Gordonia humi]|uniref:Uncharacterized protein n=1 Tax=Gordonia humi TaxID=686429 RepID=A0A840ETW0_9ACTN|nr:hypothetical protein [Gordonia humi]